jgi:hypothetical protein
VAGSRNYEQVLAIWGSWPWMWETEDGLKWFKQFEERIRPIRPRSLIKAWRGQASTLFSLGRVEEAHACLESPGVGEQGNADRHQILVVLAQLHLLQLPSA